MGLYCFTVSSVHDQMIFLVSGLLAIQPSHVFIIYSDPPHVYHYTQHTPLPAIIKGHGFIWTPLQCPLRRINRFLWNYFLSLVSRTMTCEPVFPKGFVFMGWRRRHRSGHYQPILRKFPDSYLLPFICVPSHAWTGLICVNCSSIKNACLSCWGMALPSGYWVLLGGDIFERQRAELNC